MPPSRKTRSVSIGTVVVGGSHPVVVQSMCATKTADVEATARQAQALHKAGAGVVRLAVDNAKDAEAVAAIADHTDANLCIDLQENYPMAAIVAPHVAKLRYNPGHLYHLEKGRSVRDKVKFLADIAGTHDCAIRVGVNCGSVDPAKKGRFGDDSVGEMVASALEHCEILDSMNFHRYVVSLKDSDPKKVVDANKRFNAQRPDVPLHLGVTEAGLPPEGVIKTRIAFEQLLAAGIGDTLRVSLTVPNDKKPEEVEAGQQIIDDVAQGRFRSVPDFGNGRLNIISCPSCSRVENEKFVELAQDVKALTSYAEKHALTIAVMGCRVNGPGETDDADLGLWCGPTHVNLKKGENSVGSYTYEEILPKLRKELDTLIAANRR